MRERKIEMSKIGDREKEEREKEVEAMASEIHQEQISVPRFWEFP